MSVFSLIVTALLQAAPAASPTIDAILAEWTSATPGCAVGVEVDGRTVLEKGFGMADLERGVPNRGDTIFEAGSVSKQFTAAAVLLLARDGKLSLDDQVRKYVPELPDYGTPLTIRHMLTHTSGLRDWGSVEGIAGWPRTSREYTHAHVIVVQQLRLQPRRDHRVACQRHELRGVHEAADLPAARDDPHVVARRPHAYRAR
jgi:CubicO group peptidase (beta-lactamase class C family)